MLARDIMSPEVATIDPHATVEKAARMMVQKNVSCLPVTNNLHELVGIVTHTDFVAKKKFLPLAENLYTLLGSIVNPHSIEEAASRLGAKHIKEVMTTPVITIEEYQEFGEVVKKMVTMKVNRLPVLKSGHIVGIITRHDLLKAMVNDS